MRKNKPFNNQHILQICFFLLLTFTVISCKKKGSDSNNIIPEPPTSEVSPMTSVILNPTADASIEAYNNAFLVTEGASKQYYKTALNNSEKDYYWCQALEIQMMQDVYLRTKSEAHKKLIENLLQTFLAQNQGPNGLKDWDWNEFNDDVLWAGIAFVRGYQITGNTLFLSQAEYAFKRVYDRGYDNVLGGGIWWDIRKENKSGLSNNTAVILACYLYESTNNPEYFIKAKSIYDWIKANLYNEANGAVYENINREGIPATDANVYNVGAFVSAANHLHRLTGETKYFEDAKRSVDYTKNNSTVDGIMSRRQRGGTWQSEFARGIGEFVRDNNLWDTYYPWMKQNADAAWNAKRNDLKVAWNDWVTPTPADNVTSALECASAVVMLQVTPATKPQLKENVAYRLVSKLNKESALEAGTASSKISKWASLSNQTFKLTSVGNGYYKLSPENASGFLSVANGATTNNAAIVNSGSASQLAQYWKVIYDYDGFYKLKPQCAPLSCLTVKNSTAQNNTETVLYREKFLDNERWFLMPKN